MRRLVVLGCGLLWLAAFARGGEAAVGVRKAPRHPNVLLIVIDTLRADHVSAYGYDKPTTPYLDTLAGEGIRFANHFSGAPWTTPSIATLFTGRAVAEHGLDSVRGKLPDGLPTLAERMRDAGYHTLAALCNPCAAGRMGFSRGFDRYDDFTVALDLEMNLFGGGTPRRVHEAVTGPSITKTFLRHMTNRPKDKPWFGFVLYYDPHDLYMPAEKHRRLFSERPPGKRAPDAERTPGSEALAESLARYDGEIRATDEEIETLVARLRAAGHFSDDDLLIVTADHGEEFREHGGLRHGGSFFNELIHVPLIMRWPERLPAGGVVDALTAHEDVADSILRAVGVPPVPPVAATSSTRADLWALATGASDIGRAAVPLSGDDGRRLLGWRTRDWLITIPRTDDPPAATAKAWNLRDDPLQQHPLRATASAESMRLAEALTIWFRAAERERGRLAAAAATTETALTAKEVEVLKSLGYLH